MATDRNKKQAITIITRVTYSKPGPDLLQKTVTKVKDIDNVVHIISNTGWVNVGKRSVFKKELKDERDELITIRDDISVQYTPRIEFLDEQIADIEAL